MTVLFRTDGSVVGRGFNAEFMSSLSPNSGTIMERLMVGLRCVKCLLLTDTPPVKKSITAAVAYKTVT